MEQREDLQEVQNPVKTGLKINVPTCYNFIELDEQEQDALPQMDTNISASKKAMQFSNYKKQSMQTKWQ